MLKRLAPGRALTFGVSCLLHVVLIGAIVLAERWILSAHASRPPVLPVELVTAGDPPPPEPAPRNIEPPRPIAPRPLRLPKPIEAPRPRIAETTDEPPPPPEPRPMAPEPTETVPAVAAVSPAANAASEAAPATRPGPAPAPGPAPPAPGHAEGIPVGRASPAPAPAPAVASAPSRDGGSTGAVTQYARPQGGYQVRPGYPSTARRLGIQGTALLKVHVLIDGRVGEVVVQESAGHPDLDQAAADAVRRWHFEPARRGTEPVAMWVLLPVEFRLK